MYNVICGGGFLQEALFEGIDRKPIVLYMKRLDRGRVRSWRKRAGWELRKLMKYSVFNATNSLHEIKAQIVGILDGSLFSYFARPRLKPKAFVKHFLLDSSGPAGQLGTTASRPFSPPIFIMLNWAFTLYIVHASAFSAVLYPCKL
jgi:hypothetical protein